jgi:circadian clock protein KaiB
MANGSHFEFRLFVAGESANSVQAIANLTAFCREYLEGRYKMEIVDVLQEPDKGLEAKVLLTPTLLKVSPTPLLRVVGNLSNLGHIHNLIVQEAPAP